MPQDKKDPFASIAEDPLAAIAEGGETAGERYYAARRAGKLPRYNVSDLPGIEAQALQNQAAGVRGGTPQFSGTGPNRRLTYTNTQAPSFLQSVGLGMKSGLVEAAGVTNDILSGLQDPKTMAAFIVSKLSPAGQAAASAYFGLQSSQQMADAIHNGKLTPENVQKFFEAAAGYVGSASMASERSPRTIKERLANVNEKARSFARSSTEVKPAVRATLEKGGQVAERLNLEKNVDTESTLLGNQIKEVENKVWKEGNRKFEAVKEKVGADKPGEPVANSQPLADKIKAAESTLAPDQAGLLRRMTKMIEPPEEVAEASGSIRREVMQSQGMGADYEKLPANQKALVDDLVSRDIARRYGADITKGDPITWSKLQRMKTATETAMRSASTSEVMKYSLAQVDDTIVEMMGKMAEEKGAGTEWNDARNFWREWREDFHEARGPSGSGSPVAAALEAKDPAFIRRAFSGKTDRGVSILRKYGQFGGNDVAGSVERTFQKEARTKELPRKAAGVQVAGQPKPTVDIDQVARQKIQETAQRIGRLNAWDARVLAGSALAAVFAPFLGVKGGIEIGGSYVGAKIGLAKALENPKVINWIAKTPPEELQALRNIKGVDQVQIKSALTDALAKANGFPDQSIELAAQDRARAELGPNADPRKFIQRAQEIKQSMRYQRPVISPELRSYLGPENVAKIAAASSGTVTKPVQNRREALERLQPQP